MAKCERITLRSFVPTSLYEASCIPGDLTVRLLTHGIAGETFDYSLLTTRVRVLPTHVLAPHGTPVDPFSRQLLGAGMIL